MENYNLVPGGMIPVTGLMSLTAGEPIKTFASGAKRSNEDKAPLHLLPREPLRRLAYRYGLGLKYGKDNWRTGLTDPAFIDEAFNRIIEHLYLYNEKREKRLPDDCDDDLAAAAWGCFFLMEAQRVSVEGRCAASDTSNQMG